MSFLDLSQDGINKSIEEFKLRIAEDREFCEELFKDSTIKLLAAKYAYYKRDNPYLKDDTYDLMEKDWFIMGRALGHLKEDETSPCVDFDESHPLASEAIALADRLKI